AACLPGGGVRLPEPVGVPGRGLGNPAPLRRAAVVAEHRADHRRPARLVHGTTYGTRPHPDHDAPLRGRAPRGELTLEKRPEVGDDEIRPVSAERRGRTAAIDRDDDLV